MYSKHLIENLKFVTGNPNKIREAQDILGFELDHAEIDLEEIQTYDIRTAVTAKVNQAWETLKCPVMVEDSGLIFSSWNGLPGALVKWFEKTVGCDGLLRMLKDFDDRRAFAVCMVAIHDGKEVRVAEGRVQGKISESMKGDNGFGWDVIFIPDGYSRTYAEMDHKEKNSISHRRHAFEGIKKLL
jgi:non-canonical purine NTP pyrophosphatase (RdgB/HAM1 family)